MGKSRLFDQNIELWAITNPKEAKVIAATECKTIHFCTTGKEEQPNLKKQLPGKVEFFHSTEDVNEEAKKWFFNLDLVNVPILYVYGVGLGYYYQSAKYWLQNPENFIIFLEDDCEVIHRLFETELGAEILHHKQVLVKYTSNPTVTGALFEDLDASFLLKPYKVTALNFYRETKAPSLQFLTNSISLTSSFETGKAIEYLSLGKGVYNNFYKNALELSGSYLANSMWGKFKDVPAIICGAGPSLDKNLNTLETLKDRALIFAGGSAMNAVNVNGFLPHFGVGIDPNWAQYSRLLANIAYEVPYFYRNRMFYEAMRLISGDRLFVTGSAGHGIAEWFEEKLGIKYKEIQEGFNVINFSIALAQALGCNPIILVGVDLAYTDSQSYAKGVKNHPIHDPRENFQTKNNREELLLQNDINGWKTLTLWKWIQESLWYHPFISAYKGLVLINSTEGGIGFPGIANIRLAKIAEKLQTNYDFTSIIHCEIQNSIMPLTVTKENIREQINLIKKSLEKCQSLCKTLSIEFFEVMRQLEIHNVADVSLISEKTMEALTQLDEEDAYTYILNNFNDSYLRIFGTKFQAINEDPELEKEINLKKAELNTRRYEFLKNTAYVNLQVLESALKTSSDQEVAKKTFFNPVIFPEPDPNEKYSFENGMLTIIDPEMKLSIQENYTLKKSIAGDTSKILDGQILSYYENGSLKSEQYYLEGSLNGPSTFFAKEGTTLSRLWFVKGKQQGKGWFYYHSGELYSIRRFVDGLQHGQQIYFHKDGTYRSIINYSYNKLDGEVLLYHPSGQLHRELHYRDGKQEGVERLWFEDGQLNFETFYKQGLPVGITRTWYSNGKLAQQSEFDENSKLINRQRWDLNGRLWNPEENNKDDYFDKVTKQTNKLTNAIEGIVSQVSSLQLAITSSITSKEKPDFDGIQEMLNEVQKKMNWLKEVNAKLHHASGLSPENKGESIWKTPSIKREMELTLEKISKKMSDEITSINDCMKIIVQQLIKKSEAKK
jgi:hypothetical protein